MTDKNMDTEQLIQSLVRDVRPIRRNAVGRRIALGATCGAVFTVALVVAVLGLRPDLRVALHGFSFWMKWAYTISGAACDHRDRAAGPPDRRLAAPAVAPCYTGTAAHRHRHR